MTNKHTDIAITDATVEHAVEYIQANLVTIQRESKAGDIAAECLLHTYDAWVQYPEDARVRFQVLAQLEVYLKELERKARVR
jgi:hypothetical protein